MELTSCNPAKIAASLQEMEFKQLASFNTAHIGVFWSEAGGPGPWEMHPDSDELLSIIEGEVEIELLPESGPAIKTNLTSGDFLVVPKGHWHRHNMLKRSKEMYLSPANTEHSTDPDPRSS